MFTPRLLKLKIHSRRVSVFKRLLPICAFLLTSVMIAWPALKEQKDVLSSSVPVKVGIKETQNDMEQIRFFSKDDNQNPFTVVAESVRETDPSRQIVLMDKPKATYRMKNNTVLTGITPFGMAFQQEHYLYFENQVDMTSTDGYQGNSSKVICEYEQGRLGSDSNVYIKGPAGMLTAQGFFAKDNGDYIHFKNHTESLLFHTPKAVSEIESLKYESMKDYLKQNEQNIFIVSDNGLIINQEQQTVKALKNVQITQGNSILTAPQVTLSYRKLKNGETEVTKFDAENKVTFTTPTQSATGTHLTFYKDPAEIQAVLKTLPAIKEINSSQAPGQIVLIEGNAEVYEKPNKLTADKLYVLYDSKGEKIEKSVAVGNMAAQNETQKIQGEYGVYTTATEVASVYKNVVLTEKDSVLKGNYASLNMKTGISSLTAPEQKNGKKGRVKGSIVPNNFKESEEK